MIENHLPALQVVLPLIAAPICFILYRPFLSWLTALVVSTISTFFSITILLNVLDQGLMVYNFGGWEAPFGISYRVDLVNAFLLTIVTSISSVLLIFAKRSVSEEIDSTQHSIFYTAWLLCLTGLLGISITGDAFNLFVFLEISSLSSYVLIAMGSKRQALTASFQYLIMGTIGATFILIGVGLLYAITGTLDLLDLAQRLQDLSNTKTARTAFAFLTVGIGLKLALFPLHLWLPNAYAYAPSVVSAFLAATATKVAVYVLIRFIFSVFGVDFALGTLPLSSGLAILGSIAIISASIVCIFQDNLKRMLAYSSVAQVGYFVIGISLASSAGLAATLLHIFNHALMKGALFMCLGCIAWQYKTVNLNDLRGLGLKIPWTMGVFFIGSLSLIGVPLTAGFISKWYMIIAALDKGWWPIILVIIIGSLLAVTYIWRVIEALYFRTEPNVKAYREAPLSMLLPAWLLALANIYFGIYTDFSYGIAVRASYILLGL